MTKYLGTKQLNLGLQLVKGGTKGQEEGKREERNGEENHA